MNEMEDDLLYHDGDEDEILLTVDQDGIRLDKYVADVTELTRTFIQRLEEEIGCMWRDKSPRRVRRYRQVNWCGLFYRLRAHRTLNHKTFRLILSTKIRICW